MTVTVISSPPRSLPPTEAFGGRLSEGITVLGLSASHPYFSAYGALPYPVPFYGKEASDKLFELLAGHYGAIKKYLNAEFANDKEGMQAARDELVSNADRIAAFLSSANPNWPKATLEDLLRTHGAHHLSQIDYVAHNDFASEAVNWSTMKKHIYMIADALAAGSEAVSRQVLRKGKDEEKACAVSSST
jgi:hypothetical protein